MPLNQPLAGDVHVNKPLTNFAQLYIQSASIFVAGQAIPNIPVVHQSDQYYIFDRDDMFRDDVEERSDGAESSGSGFTLSDDTYLCKVYGYHKDVSDRQRANHDNIIKLDRSASRFVAHKALIKRERLFATKMLTSGNWTGGTQNKDWTSTSSTPIADIRLAKRTVQEKTGMIPNKMLMGRKAYDTLLDNDEILARITGGANTSMPALVMRTLLAQLLELDAIYVMDAVYNTANKGAARSMSFIGDDTALIYYAPDTVSAEGEPTAAAQFSWTGFTGATDNGMRIRKFRMENLLSDRIEVDMAFDFKITGPDLGYTFTTVSQA